MVCTRCNTEIRKKQPYCRTKKGPHHFRKSDCSGIETVDILWQCHKGHKFFSMEAPTKCPECEGVSDAG